VVLNIGHSEALGKALVYRGVPAVICWRSHVHANAMQAFSLGLIKALEADASAACAFTSARNRMVQRFAAGHLMKEGDPVLDEAGHLARNSPHGTPLLLTAEEMGCFLEFSHLQPNGKKGDNSDRVIVSGMSIKEFVAPAIGTFGIVSSGKPVEQRELEYDVWTKETWQAMRQAKVVTSDPIAEAVDLSQVPRDQYCAELNAWIPVDRPRPGQALYDTLGLLPGGYLREVLMREPPEVPRGHRSNAMLPKSPTSPADAAGGATQEVAPSLFLPAVPSALPPVSGGL